MSDAGNWCLIESDPGVFTEMLRELGVKGLQVEELYSLDESEFTNLRPVHGLVFLFKYRPGEDPSGQPYLGNNVFFAQQVIMNACATQAIVNLLLNVESPEVQLGSVLDDYRTFTTEMDPSTRGLCLSNSESIRRVHNSFSRQHLFELDIKGGKEEDNYHFITYVPIRGKVYELDGLQEYPMEVGTIGEGQDWLDVVRPAIQSRINRYSEGEIHFNLMAVISDRKDKYIRRLDEIANSGMETEDCAAEICELQNLIEEEDAKLKKQRKENVRRRHNYVPFIVEMMRCLAREGKLVPLVQQAIDNADKKRKSDDEKRETKESVASP